MENITGSISNRYTVNNPVILIHMLVSITILAMILKPKIMKDKQIKESFLCKKIHQYRKIPISWSGLSQNINDLSTYDLKQRITK